MTKLKSSILWQELEIQVSGRSAPLPPAVWMRIHDSNSPFLHVISLSATLSSHGNSSGTLWLRADGPFGPLEFASSTPVNISDSPKRSEVRLRAPSMARRIAFGLVAKGDGFLNAHDLILVRERLIPRISSARALFDEAIELIKARAWNADHVDWDRFCAAHALAVSSAVTSVDLYPVIRAAVRALQDDHSHFLTPEGAEAYCSFGEPTTDALVSSGPRSVGYIRLPGFAGTEQSAVQEFADRVESQVLALVDECKHGWVIDLRTNSGGNMWPMMGAIRTFLGSGNIGAFHSRSGQLEYWHQHLKKMFGQRIPCATLEDRPVAVLLSSETNSAGEAIAVALQGRPRTRFFGSTTAGRANANESFSLCDGSQLQLMTAIDVDRTGRRFGRHVVPDVQIRAAHANLDVVLQAAVDWLADNGG